MFCINQMMQHQQIRGCQGVCSDKEHRGKMFRMSDLSSKQTNPLSKLQEITFSLTAIRGRTLRAVLWGEGASHQPGNRGSGLWDLPTTKAELSGCAGRVNLSTCSSYSIHSSACLTSQVTNNSRLHLTVQTTTSMDTLTYTYYQIN